MNFSVFDFQTALGKATESHKSKFALVDYRLERVDGWMWLTV